MHEVHVAYCSWLKRPYMYIGDRPMSSAPYCWSSALYRGQYGTLFILNDLIDPMHAALFSFSDEAQICMHLSVGEAP